jgi:serine protease inhibitor
MMRRSARFAYARRDWGEVVELPFTDPRFVFVAALPRADAALIEAAVPATSELLQPLDSSLRAPVKGEVALPRLSMRDRRRLQSPLAAAGLQRVFTGGGAFDALLEPAPTLGAMVQASSFSMDEKGAVAASATAVIALRSLELSAFKMTFDRPFFFAILRRGVASPLMMGYVASLGG